MQYITRNEVQKLENDPLSFAIMMDDSKLENVIVAFVSVLIKRKQYRGG